MNLIISWVMLLMCNLEILKTELLNPKETKKVLNLTKFVNENDLSKCKVTLEGTYFPEIPYVYLYCDDTLEPIKNELDSKHCSGFDCWESQLSLVSRVEIIRIMNQYREKVSKGTCQKWCERNKKRVIFELLWDRDQEIKIIDIIKNCPQKESNSTLETVTHNGIELNSRTDFTVTSFKMETGSQQELRLILWRLMSENHLDDWNKETWQFRRSLMFEIGCAFVIRREVNYVTALNEKVENGNVGHFGCIFHSILPNAEPPDSLEPSVSNCKQQAGPVGTNFDDYNYFPNLCRINLGIAAPNLIKPAHSCKEGPKNGRLCASTNYSTKTWDEKFYGLILKLVNSEGLQVKADCNVPKDIPPPEKCASHIFDYNCTLKEEVLVLADNSNCSNWDCEDSQLTDITRVKILERLNEARILVANGKCSDECSHPCEYCKESIQYCNMAKLQWHWFLERKASQIVRRCSTEYSFRENLIYEDNPFPDPVIFDEISLVLNLPSDSGGQIALGKKIFTELFWTNTFKDWSDDNKFRRANAAFIGCSIIVRSNVEIQSSQNNAYKGTKIHMVCIYTTLQKQFVSKSENSNDSHCCASCSEPVYLTNPCQLQYVKRVPPYSNLCSSTTLQFTMNCQTTHKSNCEHNGNSEAWKEEYAGMTIHQNIDGSFVGICREKRKRNPIMILILMCILAIIALLLLSVFLYKKRSMVIATDSLPTQLPKVKHSTQQSAVKQSTQQPTLKHSTQQPTSKHSTQQPTLKHSTTEVLQKKEIKDHVPKVSTRRPRQKVIVRKVPKKRAHLYQ